MADVKFTIPQELSSLRDSFRETERQLQDPRPILKAIGVALLGEVGRIFRQEGTPKWKSMAESTRRAKRQGSGKLLSGLQPTFDIIVEQRKITLFSRSKIAVFHEYGTKGPYIIRAKNAKALALPFAAFSLKGAGRSGTTPSRGLMGTGGKVTRPHGNIAFFIQVTHPGLAARPMLPTPERGAEIAGLAGRGFLQKTLPLLIARKGGRRV